MLKRQVHGQPCGGAKAENYPLCYSATVTTTMTATTTTTTAPTNNTNNTNHHHQQGQFLNCLDSSRCSQQQRRQQQQKQQNTTTTTTTTTTSTMTATSTMTTTTTTTTTTGFSIIGSPSSQVSKTTLSQQCLPSGGDNSAASAQSLFGRSPRASKRGAESSTVEKREYRVSSRGCT